MRDRQKDITERAAKDLAEHQVVQRLDQGLWRSWRCQRPGSWAYGFDVTTGPGWLLIHGDIGSCYFTRELDMLEWLKKSQGDIDYMAGKTEGGPYSRMEYDDDMAKAELSKQLKEARKARDKERAKKIIGVLRDVDISDEHGLYSALQDNDLDVYDIPTCRNWTYAYLWQVEALRWFLKTLAEQERGKNASSGGDP